MFNLQILRIDKFNFSREISFWSFFLSRRTVDGIKIEQ